MFRSYIQFELSCISNNGNNYTLIYYSFFLRKPGLVAFLLFSFIFFPFFFTQKNEKLSLEFYLIKEILNEIDAKSYKSIEIAKNGPLALDERNGRVFIGKYITFLFIYVFVFRENE